MKILIIDDQHLIRNYLAKYFRVTGNTAITASSVKKARTLIEKETFDVALVDFRMLDGMGTDIVSQIKEQRPKAKIIGMSGTEQSSSFYKAGADAFIKKPFNDKELMTVIELVEIYEDILIDILYFF